MLLAVLDLGIFGTVGGQLGQFGVSVFLALLQVRVTALHELLAILEVFLFEFGLHFMQFVFVHRAHQPGRQVNDFLQLLGLHLIAWLEAAEQVGQPRTSSLEVPNVHHWCGEFDVTHAVTTHARTSYFNTALVADDALELDSLVFSAGALEVTGWPEDFFTEQPVALGAQGAVVDGLGLFYLAKRPLTDVFSSGQANAHLSEVVDFRCWCDCGCCRIGHGSVRPSR